MDIIRSHPEKRRNQHPGLIEEFLADKTRETMTIKLYPREIRRLERDFPQIDITKGARFKTTDLWECIISRR